ncbi:Isochorismatase hydrolase [Panus rudis PR-1116 ss-1]|nr:Isochorismatase hydrolase [Panus rudis PR-1116 ss-1]
MSTSFSPSRPKVSVATEYGNAASFWVEYPTGLIDLTRSAHLPNGNKVQSNIIESPVTTIPPALDVDSQFELDVDGRTVRLGRASTAIVIIDMQNFFLHPDLRQHPTGLACVDPLLKAVPALRSLGAEIIWVNWGLTDPELLTIPPSLVRGFTKSGRGGFGSRISTGSGSQISQISVSNENENGKGWGRLLMRGEKNADLYGPLQELYERGVEEGTDVWVHKNRMSGLWGPQSALDLHLQERGITSLLFAGVNADQCVLGTLVDSYFRGYDCIVLRDAIATTSPTGGLENVLYNSAGSYGFVTDTTQVVDAVKKFARAT